MGMKLGSLCLDSRNLQPRYQTLIGPSFVQVSKVCPVVTSVVGDSWWERVILPGAWGGCCIWRLGGA